MIICSFLPTDCRQQQCEHRSGFFLVDDFHDPGSGAHRDVASPEVRRWKYGIRQNTAEYETRNHRVGVGFPETPELLPF
eukprot:2289140-Prymnesium_polylepis.1